MVYYFVWQVLEGGHLYIYIYGTPFGFEAYRNKYIKYTYRQMYRTDAYVKGDSFRPC